MSDTETRTDTLVTECPKCEQQMAAAEHLYRTWICPVHGPWFHDDGDDALGDPGHGWLPIGMSGL